MKDKFKPFTTSLIGSFPRSKELLSLKRKLKLDKKFKKEYDNLLEEETKKVVKLQEKYSIDIITNGELTRDNYVSFISDRLKGVVMMNMSDMLDYIEDKKAFEIKTKEMINLFEGRETSVGKCNGTLTVSENIADAGGLSCALAAAKLEKDYNAKDFYINFATI